MSSPIELFSELFRGNTSTYGIHIPAKETKEGEKAKGESYTKSEPLVYDLYEAHCKGQKSIGVVPIDQNSNVRFIAIDVDVYPLEPKRYCYIIEKFKLPLTCFRSKSGGLHIYCFFSSDTPAKKALESLNKIRHILRIPKDTETFPKQTKLTAKQKGNWINLPYYGGESTERYAYGPNGERLGFEEAMRWCYGRRVTLKGLEATISGLPFAPAPPCLQAMYVNNEVSVTARNRNTFLFNAAVYLKSRFGEEFPDKLAMVNEELDKPLELLELERTIIASHSKGSYTYQCEDVFLHEHCDKELCKQCEYGKGSGAVSNFSFEKLIQVKSNPPYYKWTVNGVEMVFFSELELRSQDRFMDYCMRYLHRLPNKLKNETWTEILNGALQDIEVEEIRADEDLSNASLWFGYLKEFLTERRIAQRPSQIHMGQVYAADNGFYFKAEHFVHFLTEMKRFKAYTTSEIHYNLRMLGFAPKRLYDPASQNTLRAWFGEASIIEKDFVSAEAVLTPEFHATPPEVEEPPAKKEKVDGRGAARLKKLVEELPDEPLDFTELVEKEKF